MRQSVWARSDRVSADSPRATSVVRVGSVVCDGVTEGRLEDGNMLGVEGLKQLWEASLSLSAVERLAAIADRLHRPGATLHDDLTVLAIEHRVAADAAR